MARHPAGESVKNRRTSEIAVGITVIAGIVILLFGFSVFKEWSVSRDLDVISIRFPTSSGLQVGDPVFMNGVKVGGVLTVSITGNTVLVTAEVDRSTHLASDAVPVIQVLELMGGKKIEIRQGTSPTPMDYSSVIEGRVDPDFGSALGLLGTVQGNITDLGNNANTLLVNANNLIGDKALVADLKATVANLHTISTDVRSLLKENRSDAERLVDNLVRLSSRTDTLLSTLEPRITRSLDQAGRTMTQVDTLLAGVHAVVRDIRDSRGLVYKALHDTTMNTRIDAMLAKLDSLASHILDGQMRIKIRL